MPTAADAGIPGGSRRLLSVHYYFPPLGGIASIRALKFARYLPEFGWRPTVIAPANGFYHRDPSLDSSGIAVERTFSPEISRGGRAHLLGRQGTDYVPARPRGWAALLQRLVRRHVYRPDAQIGWYPFALQAARRALRERRFDAVFSSSSPITSHLVARQLRCDFGVPWIADFRDPWTDLVRYDSARRRAAEQRLEARLLSDADAVVTVSDGMADHLSARGARRVFVIQNGFDPEDYPPEEEPEDAIVYLGTYYPGRQDLETMLRAIAELAAEGELPRTRVRFVGDCGSHVLELVRHLGLEGRFEETGFLPHRSALQVVGRARLLLLAGLLDESEDDPIVRGVLPAKTSEYVGARRPILYVGNSHGDAPRMLRRVALAEVVPPRDIAGAKAAIRRLLGAGRPTLGDEAMAYTRRALTGRLAAALDAVTSTSDAGNL